ncbi:peptidoglycan-binding domain-containing protein [Streptomyces sp. 21So2-11]|uniref:peptidoglycan-binding domain-containing protein n=1 Tax=Streptomyces sp. 21So2-11 TaxID=3144408 RepID=UPI00321ADA2E
MSGHICPGCGAERGTAPDGDRPDCGCAERAVAAARAERAAEIAAAEDFDPLRIRPYVTLPDPDTQDDAVSAGDADAGDADGDTDGARRGAPGAAYPGQLAPDGPRGPRPTVPVGPVQDRLPPGPGVEPPVRRRGRPALWLVVAGAVATATVGTVAFAGGLFSADNDQDRALPATVTSAPGPSDEPVAPASASATADRASKAPSAPAAASPSAPPPPSRTPSADLTPSASKTVEAPPAPPPSTAQATGTVDTAPEQAADALSMGDSGPEVVELQDRLGQVWLYQGPGDGSYTTDVEQAVRTYQLYMSIEGDPEGTYGPHTRRALEASTKEPGRD